jgi:hypothetical protein
MIILFIIYFFLLIINKKITLPTSIRDIIPSEILSIFPPLSQPSSSKLEIDPDTIACSPDDPNCPIQIDIIDNRYMMENKDGLHTIKSLRVPVGQKVRWLNNEAEYHTVTHLQERLFNSGLLKQLDTFEYTFETPGRYWIHCREHPKTLIYIDVLDNKLSPTKCLQGEFLDTLPPNHFQPEKGVQNI